ncbi:hypothetical protein [Thalassolituus oleivorans]|uniref:hypothetical protein n=1 Tax=Thalassolituus oleivorans TaxID=187493 RepID=UPI0024094D53|nr:hypothetical protein [Thalassolituus oleivorans]MDF1642507.1 hypothetical protein [Thalassolituus oleivorans]
MSEKLTITQKAVETYLNKIAEHFKPGTQFTFIARTPGNGKADFVVSTEQLEKAAEVIQRRIEAR